MVFWDHSSWSPSGTGPVASWLHHPLLTLTLDALGANATVDVVAEAVGAAAAMGTGVAVAAVASVAATVVVGTDAGATVGAGADVSSINSP